MTVVIVRHHVPWAGPEPTPEASGVTRAPTEEADGDVVLLPVATPSLIHENLQPGNIPPISTGMYKSTSLIRRNFSWKELDKSVFIPPAEIQSDCNSKGQSRYFMYL